MDNNFIDLKVPFKSLTCINSYNSYLSPLKLKALKWILLFELLKVNYYKNNFGTNNIFEQLSKYDLKVLLYLKVHNSRKQKAQPF